MFNPTPICFKLPRQRMRLARSLALASAGNSSAARMAMMAMTTSSSMSVNAGAESAPQARRLAAPNIRSWRIAMAISGHLDDEKLLRSGAGNVGKTEDAVGIKLVGGHRRPISQRRRHIGGR